MKSVFKSGWAKGPSPAEVSQDEAERKPLDSVFDDLVRSRTGVGGVGKFQITVGLKIQELLSFFPELRT